MKKLLQLILIKVMFLSPICFAAGELFQVAPLSALVKGVYVNSGYRYAELEKHGDFGLGTFDYLAGEMVALNGKFYQMEADGNIIAVDKKLTTPFAEVCYFKPDVTNIDLINIQTFKDLATIITKKLEYKNGPYAIKISGYFPYLKLRAVLKQNQPGVPLALAAKQEKIFEFHNVKGTLVGYWFPQYLSGIAVGGFHFHFISDDLKHGGHVLDLQLTKGVMDFMRISNFNMYFLTTAQFNQADLNDNSINKDINNAENLHTNSQK